jgi:hypothetical protein
VVVVVVVRTKEEQVVVAVAAANYGRDDGRDGCSENLPAVEYLKILEVSGVPDPEQAQRKKQQKWLRFDSQPQHALRKQPVAEHIVPSWHPLQTNSHCLDDGLWRHIPNPHRNFSLYPSLLFSNQLIH